MKVKIERRLTYVITGVRGLDPISAIVTRNGPGSGSLMLRCYSKCWSGFWPAMGREATVEQFVQRCSNEYLINSMGVRCTETDYDAINKAAKKAGFPNVCVEDEGDVHNEMEALAQIYGPDDWWLHLPTRTTAEYRWLEKILDAVREAFRTHAEQQKETTDEQL